MTAHTTLLFNSLVVYKRTPSIHTRVPTPGRAPPPLIQPLIIQPHRRAPPRRRARRPRRPQHTIPRPQRRRCPIARPPPRPSTHLPQRTRTPLPSKRRAVRNGRAVCAPPRPCSSGGHVPWRRRARVPGRGDVLGARRQGRGGAGVEPEEGALGGRERDVGDLVRGTEEGAEGGADVVEREQAEEGGEGSEGLEPGAVTAVSWMELVSLWGEGGGDTYWEEA